MSADNSDNYRHTDSQSGAGLEMLLAQLRGHSDQGTSPHGSSSMSHSTTHHQQSPAAPDSFYAPHQYQQPAGSPPSLPNAPPAPAMHPPAFQNSAVAALAASSALPSAPTPPAGGGFPNASFPPSLLGSIGSGRAAGDRASSSHLLNLLKFSGNHTGSNYTSTALQPPAQSEPELEPEPAHQPQVKHAAPTTIHAPAPAPSDPTGLLAALMRGSLKEEGARPEPTPAAPSVPAAPSATSSTQWASTSQASDTQQYLLNLLNRPKPSQSNDPASVDAPNGPNRLTPSSVGSHHAGNHPQQPLSAGASPSTTLFSHHDPFNGLVSAPSLDRTPKSSTTTGGTGSAPSPVPSATATMETVATVATAATAKPVQILRKPSHQQAKTDKHSSSEPSPAASPSFVGDKKNAEQPQSTAFEADDSSYETAGSEAKDDDSDATAAVHHGAAQSPDNDDAANGNDFALETEAESDTAAHIRDGDDKQDGQENDVPSPTDDIAQDDVDDVTREQVVDSWESADVEAGDGDEVTTVETQSSPVKVYNFPMKPWISIDVQDGDLDNLPVFGEGSILDIARLKKEFDQIDRNLVAASEYYMVYGMSKAGGLRVIRQSDGRDAKLFTDTRDRIFNVALSVSNSDAGAIPRDATIGTGISGTVYWVQIRDGDKDHLDYAHPELYGFALPPIPSHEGDAPGGVLKTRARTSASHPEYFAVGRGKSINIVWPAFIMQNNLFLPGHDRVVDTEKLAKQCSLKINTGKAGKDFSFSQDDTIVVSLDKSGRVKFWDVRDLTTPSENADPRHPLPAHTSLEIKEPIMTLTTTPEGEKAWPTSVLLLDKVRPYQKGSALRYMIIGMKQNHTLQLWDLALGKPVQEFNLPHSKESDAVCSVMYHPPTGMIVVGHPTRNSVYFLHLSAPKYAMKSMSQVDYIQRLAAQDASLPQPDSTAVISGLREYSISNRGALRSLDILESPATNPDDDNPTLFELYAMHSKGVSCLFVRQAELGWTKDNKVMEPVDAVEAGKVKIGKLKTPQQPAPSAEQPRGAVGGGAQPAPRILTSRPANRVEPVTSGHKSVETSTLSSKLRLPVEPREDAASGDKSEKRGRKKKAAAGSTAPAANTSSFSDRETAGLSNGSGTVRSPPVLLASKTPADVLNAASVSTSPSGASQSATLNISQEVIDSRINTMEARICERVSSSVHVAFDDMRQNLNQQLHDRDADFEKRQHELLDVVSKVLNSNTEQVLSKIVRAEFDKSVVPVLRRDVSQSVAEQLGGQINAQVATVLQRELQRALPAQLATSVSSGLSNHLTSSLVASLRNPEISKAVSDKVAQAVTRTVDDLFSQTLANDLLPRISSIASQIVQDVTAEQQAENQRLARQLQTVQATIQAELAQSQAVQAAQNEKIDTLVHLVTRLSDTVATLAAAQTQPQHSQLPNLQGSDSDSLQQAYLPQQHQHQHQQQRPIHHAPPSSQQRGFVEPQQNFHHSPTGMRVASGGAIPGSGVSDLSPSQHAVGPAQQSQHQQHQQHQLHQSHQSHQPHQELQQQAHQLPQQPTGVLYAPNKSQEERERDEIEQAAETIDELLRAGKFDEGMMRWLQSNGKEEQLFQRVIQNYAPDFLSNLQPLVLLSVGTTVSNGMNGPLMAQKLAWTEMVILSLYQVVGQLDDQTREITPNVLMHIRSRLEGLQLQLSKVVPAGDRQLKNISQMIGVLNRLVEATSQPPVY